MASKFLVPLEVPNYVGTPADHADTGFALLYIKNGWMTRQDEGGLESDLVLRRPLDGFSLPTNATEIVAADPLITALEKLQKSLLSITITGDVTGTAAYNAGVLEILTTYAGNTARAVATAFDANHYAGISNPYVEGDIVYYDGHIYAATATNDAISPVPGGNSYWEDLGEGYRLRQTPVDWEATTGDFQILNKPAIPTLTSELTNDTGFVTSNIYTANGSLTSARVLTLNFPLTIAGGAKSTRFFESGNVVIGHLTGLTPADSGFALEIGGTAKINGSTTIIATVGATQVTLGGTSNLPEIRFIDNNLRIGRDSGGIMQFISQPGAVTGHFNFGINSNLTNSLTSGTATGINAYFTFAPTSGTAVFNLMTIAPVINQTGGASGITRGLYINPNILIAPDFRAIETATGKIILGDLAGTGTRMVVASATGVLSTQAIPTNTNIYNADGSLTAARTVTLNSFALTFAGSTSTTLFANGNVSVGTTTDAGYKLDVNGSVRAKGIFYGIDIRTGAHSFRDQMHISHTADGFTRQSAYNAAGAHALTFIGDLRFASSAAIKSVFAFNAAYSNNGTIYTGAQSLMKIFTSDAIGNTVNSTGLDNYGINLMPTLNYTTGTSTFTGFFYNPTLTSTTGLTHYAMDLVTGLVKFRVLAGAGTRMVVADTDGLLSTQDIVIPGLQNVLDADSLLTTTNNINVDGYDFSWKNVGKYTFQGTKFLDIEMNDTVSLSANLGVSVFGGGPARIIMSATNGSVQTFFSVQSDGIFMKPGSFSGASVGQVLTLNNATTGEVRFQSVTTSSGTVTSVDALTIDTTGTDITSTVVNSTTTPVITLNIPTASATNRGALSSTDWSTFNGKQDALGYTPLAGVHSIIPMASGSVTYNGLAANASALSQTGLCVRVAPYIPAQSITTSNLFISVTTATAGSLCTIVIYSDTNGVPTNLLYESADLDCSTLGLKTATTSFSFVAGTRYWLGLKTNATTSSRLHLTSISSIAISNPTANTAISFQRSGITYASPAPSPFGSTTVTTSPACALYITKA